MIKSYKSLSAMARAYKDLGCNSRYGSARDSWLGGETESETLKFASFGNPTLVPAAEKQMEKLDAVIETQKLIWESAPVGAYYSVPDVIVGRPTCMRKKTFVADESAPIAIYVSTVCSRGISAETLAKRGTTILALVMALSRIRPTSLHIMSYVDGPNDRSGETVVTAQINTSPLDLASACYGLTSAGFTRLITYELMHKLNGAQGFWPRDYRYGGPQPYLDGLKHKLNLDPKKTLMIAPAELHDELLANPIDWINQQIKLFTQENED